MDIGEYKAKVIDLFKSGKATDAQWQELAEVVLRSSEYLDGVPAIDAVILGAT